MAGTDFTAGIDPSRGCNLVNGRERDRSSKKDSANCPVTFPSSPPSHRPAHSTDFRALFPGQESTFPSPNKLELHTSFSLGKKKKKKKKENSTRARTQIHDAAPCQHLFEQRMKKGRKEGRSSKSRGEERRIFALNSIGRGGEAAQRGGVEKAREG